MDRINGQVHHLENRILLATIQFIKSNTFLKQVLFIAICQGGK